MLREHPAGRFARIDRLSRRHHREGCALDAFREALAYRRADEGLDHGADVGRQRRHGPRERGSTRQRQRIRPAGEDGPIQRLLRAEIIAELRQPHLGGSSEIAHRSAVGTAPLGECPLGCVENALGGVIHIRPDGSQTLITQTASRGFAEAADEEARFVSGTLPNGLAFAGNGDILISNFGTDRLEIMTRDGETRVLVDTIDGASIGKVNFVLRDSRDRIWLTISTRTRNWMKAISPNVRDGYVALYDGEHLRVVADGFAFTDRIFAIMPDGALRILLDDDRGSAAGQAFLAAFARDEATPDLMLACGGTIAPWCASITFGGPDLRTVYVGSLKGSRIPYFRSPVAGLPMAHW